MSPKKRGDFFVAILSLGRKHLTHADTATNVKYKPGKTIIKEIMSI